MTAEHWTLLADVVSVVCLLGGAFFVLAAGVGVLRFPDLLSRMHAGTKPQTLGLVLVLVGLALRLREGGAVWALVLVVIFQMLTAPVAAHMVGRAGYRTGKVRHDLLVVDELTRDLQAADARTADELGADASAGDELGADEPVADASDAPDRPDAPGRSAPEGRPSA
ncbi:monovalent cation/H(+) antiporter subunit G [Cellulomonas sp. 179-A 9B4 NHS]|uniref:monovalent cation/H(+) antiporter subunit G n=1 Tax=Cellulomonas sp. 179-A 9B4 NHS TaxID=3142379 RepID=UPI0039A26B0E